MSAVPPPSPSPSSWRRPRSWLLAGLALALLLVAALATPPWLASGPGARLASRWLERPVAIDSLSIDPLTLQLRLRGLRVGPWHGDAAAPPELSLAEARVRIDPRSLLLGYPVIASLHLQTPHVVLARDASGRSSVQDLLDRFLSGPTGHPAHALVLRDLLVTDGSLDWDDRLRAGRHRIEGLQFELPYLSTRDADRTRPVEPRLYARLDGRLLVLYASARADDRTLTVHCEVEDLRLAEYSDLFAPPPGLVIHDGRFDARLDLAIELRHAALPGVRATGRLALRALDLRDGASGAPLLAVDAFEVPVREADLDRRALALGQVSVRGFTAHATRAADGGIDWVRLLAHLHAPAGQAAARGTPAPLRLDIDGLDLQGGAFTWHDHAVTPALDMTIRSASLTLGPLHWPEPAPVGFALALEGDHREGAYLGGTVDPGRRALDAEVRLVAIDADRFSPYYAGRIPVRIRAAPFSTRARLLAGLAGDAAYARIEGLELQLARVTVETRDAARPLATLQGLEVHGLSGDSRDGTARADSVAWQHLDATVPGGHQARSGGVQLSGAAADWHAGHYQLRRCEAHALEIPGGLRAETLIGEGLDLDLAARHHRLALFAAARLDTSGGLHADAIQLSAAEADLAAGRYRAGLMNVAGLAAPGDNRIGGASLRDGDADLAGSHFRLGSFAGSGVALGGRFALASLQSGGVDVDLAAHRAGLDRIKASGTRLQLLRRSDGSFDTGTLADALRALPRPGPTGTATAAASATPAAAAPAVAAGRLPAGAWHLAIHGLELDDGSGSLRDESLRTPAELRWSQLSLHLAEAGTRSDGPARLEASAQLDEATRIHLRGSLAADPLQGRLAIEFAALPITDWLPWLPLRLPLSPTAGSADLSGELVLGGRLEAPTLRWDGQLRLTDVALGGGAGGGSLVDWNALQANGVHFNSAPLDVAIATVTIDGLHTRLQLQPDGSFDLSRALAGDGTPSTGSTHPHHRTAPAPNPATGLPLSIGRIELRDGSLAFSDRYVKPPYAARVEGLQGSVVGLSGASPQPARLELAGKLDGGASVRVSGTVAPLRAPVSFDLGAVVRGFELGPLSSYSTRLTGFPIVRGKLSFDVHYRLDHGVISAGNQLTLDQLTLGPRQPVQGIRQLPVDLAVALLKDSDGVIQVDLPIQGTLDDPRFSFGGIVGQLVVRSVERAVSAPFRWLGSLFGGEHAEALGWIGFAPGSATLDAVALDKLQRLAQALHARPVLRLDVTARGGDSLDAQGLGQDLFHQQLMVQKIAHLIAAGEPVPAPEQVQWSAQETPGLLADAWRQVHPGQPVPDDAARIERDLRAGLRTDTDALAALAADRARATQDWLTGPGGIDPARVFLVGHTEPADTSAQPAQGIPPPAARVDFSVR